MNRRSEGAGRRSRRAAVAALLLASLTAWPLGQAQASSTEPALSAAPVPGTDVWLSVTPRPTQERISVTVPMAVAFVVNGTVDSGSDSYNESPTVENGGLLLPNVRVTDANSAGDEYQITVTGPSTLVVRNYSTYVKEEDMDAENPTRYGAEIELGAVLVTAQDENGDPLPPGERGEWYLTGTQPGTAIEDYKKYRLSLDGHMFTKTIDEDTVEMDGTITIGAPPSEKVGYTAGGLSKEPFEQELELGLEVGATRKDYSKAEDSVMAATILWKVKRAPGSEGA